MVETPQTLTFVVNIESPECLPIVSRTIVSTDAKEDLFLRTQCKAANDGRRYNRRLSLELPVLTAVTLLQSVEFVISGSGKYPT